MSKGERIGNSNYSLKIAKKCIKKEIVISGKTIVLPWRILFPRNVIFWKRI
jgi:hypothetical protein